MTPLAARASNRRAQKGATLIVALIMIALITLLVINAFTLSTSNLKSVNNMQMRDEAIASANQVIEQVVTAPFFTAVATQTFTVDINKDGVNDFSVVVAKPSCAKATKASKGYPSDVELGKTMSAGSTWNVDWDIAATVTDTATGAAVKVHQGIRALLSQLEKESTCP